MPFAKLLELRQLNEKLPTHRVVLDGKENLFFNAEDYEDFAERNKIEELQAIAHTLYVSENGNGESENGNGGNGGNGGKDKKLTKVEFEDKKRAAKRRLEKNEELHESRKLEELFGKLEELSLPVSDWFLKIEETDSGEKLMTRYVIESGEENKRDIAGVGEIVHSVHEIGREGLEIGRFKGLGEMNAEELWITTMDPARRTLLRVTLEGASQAEAMFSTLMGEDVERRRQFIEDHALDVKNLDV